MALLDDPVAYTVAQALADAANDLERPSRHRRGGPHVPEDWRPEAEAVAAELHRAGLTGPALEAYL